MILRACSGVSFDYMRVILSVRNASFRPSLRATNGSEAISRHWVRRLLHPLSRIRKDGILAPENSNTQTREHFTHIATLCRKRSLRGLLRGVYPERRRRARNETLLFGQPRMLYCFFNHCVKNLLKLGLSLRMGCRY